MSTIILDRDRDTDAAEIRGRAAPAPAFVRVAPPQAGRAARREWTRLLDEAWTADSGPVLIGVPPAGTAQVVLEWGDGTSHFVDAVATLERDFGLETVVVGTPAPATRGRPSDVVDAAGAIALSRALGERLGHKPEWDVLHGSTAAGAVIDYLRRQPAGVVAIPRATGDRRARRQAIALAVAAGTAVLVA